MTALITEESNELKRVSVIGAGSFGTSLAMVAGRNGHTVIMYARNKVIVDGINNEHRNPSYLSEFELPSNITATDDVSEALSNVDLIILALPTQTIPLWLQQNKSFIDEKTLICNTAKGLFVLDGCLLSEAIRNHLGRDQPYALISGPSFAQEIMLSYPTAVVVASKFLYHAVFIQRLLSSLEFRCYTSQDVIGVELGGALKNPLAIGAGLIEGLGMGINTMAAYVTRSSLELQQLSIAMGGHAETVSGLSGVGDLMLTAFGKLSRNRECGIRLSRGETLAEIIAGKTVEGVPTAAVALRYANACDLDLPIFRSVAAILDGSLSLPDARIALMGRPLRPEMGHRK